MISMSLFFYTWYIYSKIKIKEEMIGRKVWGRSRKDTVAK